MAHSDFVVYVVKEQGRDDLVKIGRCHKRGRRRFYENAHMNPRMLDIVAMWRMESKKDAEDKEDEAQSLFTSYTVCRGTEWYWASPDEAVEKISKVLGVPDYKPGGTMPFKVSAIYSGNAHDELREKGDIYTPRGAETGYRVQQRMWVHEEVGGPYRKVSHNTWWRGIKGKTSNDKCLTFN